MKKTKWRQLMQDIYTQGIFPKMGRLRRKFHPMEFDEWQYVQRGLFKASRTIRFIEQSGDTDAAVSDIFQVEHIRATVQEVRNAHQHVNLRILTESGIVEVFEEHFAEIVEELDVADLPTADIEALSEAGSPNPHAELRLRIRSIKNRYLKRSHQGERASLAYSMEQARREVDEALEKLKQHNEGKHERTNELPLARPWFKGLGSLCRGTILTAVDISLLGGLWGSSLSPDTTIVGSIASIATGLGDIAIGIGDFRKE